MSRRKLPWFLIKLTVSAALLWLVARGVDLAGLGSRLSRLHYPLAALAVGVMILQLLVASRRWQAILQSLAVTLPLHRLWRHCWVAQCFSQALPSAVGGDVIRVWLVHREGVTVRTATISVVLDRVLGLFALVTVVALAMLLPSTVTADPRARTILWLLVAVAAAGMAAALLLASLPSRWFAGRRVTRLAFELAIGIRNIIAGRRSALIVVSTAILVHLLSIVGIWLLARALDLHVGVLALATTVPVALLAASVPISIGGWGVREGVLVELLAAQGIAADSGLALSVLFGLALALASLPGGAWWLGGRPRLAQAAAAVESEYQAS